MATDVPGGEFVACRYDDLVSIFEISEDLSFSGSGSTSLHVNPLCLAVANPDYKSSLQIDDAAGRHAIGQTLDADIALPTRFKVTVDETYQRLASNGFEAQYEIKDGR